jgi:hypothetical protein
MMTILYLIICSKLGIDKKESKFDIIGAQYFMYVIDFGLLICLGGVIQHYFVNITIQ